MSGIFPPCTRIIITQRERESCQGNQTPALPNLPEPNLWNSALGRRAFLKRTGAATVASVVGLNELSSELMANRVWHPGSGGISLLVEEKGIIMSAEGVCITVTGTGTSQAQATEEAKHEYLSKLKIDGVASMDVTSLRFHTFPAPGPYRMSNVTVTVDDGNGGGLSFQVITEQGINSQTGLYETTFAACVPAGFSEYTITYDYAS